MSEQAEFVLIERNPMARKTNARYYLGYGRTIPLGNQQAYKPSDLKVGMIIQGHYQQGVIITDIKEHEDNKMLKMWTVYVSGQTAGVDVLEFSEYQTVIVDKEARDLIQKDES